MQSFLYPNYEKSLIKDGYSAVIGIDEAGRGPWAGPVSVAAYIFTLKNKIFHGIHDSKILNSNQRKKALKNLILYPDYYFVSISSHEEIDTYGIGKTIETSIINFIDQARKQMLKRSSNSKLIFLIDGYFKKKFDCEYTLIRKGDQKCYSIAAASIIAKERRDSIMQDYAYEYPLYGFEKHVGYGTGFHQEQLKKYGPCPIHRKSFKPIRKLQFT